MILHKLTFGKTTPVTATEAEEVAEEYLCMLAHSGQADRRYVLVSQNEHLCVYIEIAGVQAHRLKFHSKYGRESLKKVTAWFGQEPVWERLDDAGPWRDTTWTNAPFLFLFTHFLDHESPLCRGDTGKPIPLYRLPIRHEFDPGISFWQSSYRDHDSLWMSSGTLEILAYKQLALPDSKLSGYGRDICEYVEETTGVPTYYYLHRYYGRREGEDNRKCPGCGRSWRTEYPLNDNGSAWHHFGFRCEKCRLVSHIASISDEPRYAHIGEWRKPKRK